MIIDDQNIQLSGQNLCLSLLSTIYNVKWKIDIRATQTPQFVPFTSQKKHVNQCFGWVSKSLSEIVSSFLFSEMFGIGSLRKGTVFFLTTLPLTYSTPVAKGKGFRFQELGIQGEGGSRSNMPGANRTEEPILIHRGKFTVIARDRAIHLLILNKLQTPFTLTLKTILYSHIIVNIFNICIIPRILIVSPPQKWKNTQFKSRQPIFFSSLLTRRNDGEVMVFDTTFIHAVGAFRDSTFMDGHVLGDGSPVAFFFGRGPIW